MSSPWHYAMTAGPLGFYLWLLALWHSQRHPRVVSGLADFCLLALALGGVLVFGPFGQFVAQAVFGGAPDLLGWLATVAVLALLAGMLGRRAPRRLVVYHVEPAVLLAAVEQVLAALDGSFERTLTGFEDRRAGHGVSIEPSPWLRSAWVEAYGTGAETLIRIIKPRLRERLEAADARPTSVALVLYVLSMLVMVAPLAIVLLTEPRARASLRALLERLFGG
jgi:hypothetical protein